MTRYQGETRKQERRKKKTLVKRLTLVASALNRIKSTQIKSSQGISKDGSTGCPNQPKRKRINPPPRFLLGSVSPPTPAFINTLGNQPLRFGWCGIRIPGQIKRLVSRTRSPVRGRGWRWWCHRKNAWRESSSKVVLSPGPGWLVSIAASYGCLPKNTAIFASGVFRRATEKTGRENLSGYPCLPFGYAVVSTPNPHLMIVMC